MENLGEYLNKILFEDSDEEVNYDVDNSSSAVVPPPIAAGTSVDPQATMTKEQYRFYLELYDAAKGIAVDNSAGQDQGSSTMAQNTSNPALHEKSEAIPNPTIMEGTIQNGNSADLLDSQGENANFYEAAQGGISLNNQGQSDMYADYAPNYGTPDFPMLPWSQEIPQGDQLEQFSFPSVEYNASANSPTMIGSSSAALGSQHQSDVQQPYQAPQMSQSLEPMAESKADIAWRTPADTGATSQYPSQGLPALGSSSTNEALAQNFSWPSQQLAPAGSSWSPQEQPFGSTHQGLSLGSSSSPGGLLIGSNWNGRGFDLSYWNSFYRARKGRSGINASPLATQTTPSSANTRRGANWEADATAAHRLLDNVPENNHNLFQNRSNEMPIQNSAYDPRYANHGQYVDPHLRHFEASREFQAADKNFHRDTDGSNWNM